MATTEKSDDRIRRRLLEGLVIPAHPLALDAEGRFDETHQRALTRYYHAAGAGGVAVGVHSTQFEIRKPEHALLAPVLELARSTIRASERDAGEQDAGAKADTASMICIAGICGSTDQAVKEARLATDLGYDAGLLSLSSLADASEDELIDHCRALGEVIPLIGFYLQPAVGGRELPMSFWRRFVEIPRVVAIKAAPFDRYRTLDVLRAVAESGRVDEIALLTGNDDHILLDLLTVHRFAVGGRNVDVGFHGGLLGHWSYWTRRAVECLNLCKKARREGLITPELLTLAGQVTLSSAAVFDAAHGFAGVTPGMHEVLHRQGLLSSTRCLDPSIVLSPGQAEEIDRIYRAYPHLTDDEFVAAHRDDWFR